MRISVRQQLLWISASLVAGASTAGCPRTPAASEPAAVVVAPVAPGALDGGTRSDHVLRLVYQVDPKAANAAERARLAPNVREAMLRRLEELGIRGASVQAQGDRIEVRLPRLSAEDFGNAKAILSKRARFEFRMVDDEQDFIGSAVAALGGWNSVGGIELQRELVSAGQGKTVSSNFLAVTRRPGESAADARKRLEEAVNGLPRSAAGTEVSYQRTVSAGGRPEEGWRTYVLFQRAELGNEQIEHAEAQKDDYSGGWSVAIRFTPEGASTFERVTAANIKRRMAIVLDGVVESAPVIMSAIGGGRAVITIGQGDPAESEREARQLELTLRAGALPAAVVLLIEDTIPPR